MKSRAQKQKELEKSKELFGSSKFLFFADFTGVSAEKLHQLRRDMKNSGASFFVLKKRLLNLMLKEKKIEFDVKRFKSSVGTVFSSRGLEETSKPIFKMFSSLGEDAKSRKESLKKILGGYDLENKNFVEAEKVIYVGQLPPREILLAQLLGMIVAPVRSFLYVLNQRSKQMVENK